MSLTSALKAIKDVRIPNNDGSGLCRYKLEGFLYGYERAIEVLLNSGFEMDEAIEYLNSLPNIQD